MTPILHFNFVSKSYSGSISDKEIVKSSGFLDNLQPGDGVIADKDFKHYMKLFLLHPQSCTKMFLQ